MAWSSGGKMVFLWGFLVAPPLGCPWVWLGLELGFCLFRGEGGGGGGGGAWWRWREDRPDFGEQGLLNFGPWFGNIVRLVKPIIYVQKFLDAPISFVVSPDVL